MSNVKIDSFYHCPSGTYTHVVQWHDSSDAVVIDPVLDYDAPSANTGTDALDAVTAHIEKQQLRLHYILETHAHADHLSAAAVLQQRHGGRIAIGAGITQVQETFKNLFNLKKDFNTNGVQFDLLLQDQQRIMAGSMPIDVMATPGHTSDSVTYLIDDAAFVGDTLFHPDVGTARCDFPGGEAARLYRSIQKILALPAHTRLFMCHDYPEHREATPQTSIAAQKQHNIHVRSGVSEDEFVRMREKRDRTLGMPDLIIPSIQINIAAGEFPAPEDNGVSYLKLPLNLFVGGTGS